VIRSFVYSQTAVLVRHWFQLDRFSGLMEHGVRLELRIVEPQPHRGTESAAQRIVLDDPIWRADLFDRIEGQPGSFDAAHFHPSFDDEYEPSDREWSSDLKIRPWDWVENELGDLGRLLSAGSALREACPAERIDLDATDLRADAKTIAKVAETFSAKHCTSSTECFRLTRDVASSVHMAARFITDPATLDLDHLQPWLEYESRSI
jgi:hypothetical protein